jgi:UDP-N-acetylmuramoyl-tripeptide--D-alanyl-D-alanine ligase
VIRMRLSEAACPLGAVIQGGDIEFCGCSVDTRILRPAELFVALRGSRFDGHDFVAYACHKGAHAVMLERSAEVSLPRLLVKDTRVALGQLASLWRSRFEIPVVAVTGSNGKTTVKEMVASILRIKGTVLATRGNLNNDIGVPLTLFRLGQEHQYVVIEMGANHPGEIALLCEIARPTVAVITQCAPAHLQGFGSIEGVARAKGEILSSLNETGVAVINAEDDFAELWRGMAGARKQVSFSLNGSADLTATLLDNSGWLASSRFQLNTPTGSTEIRLPLPGRHNVMNALAAAACAYVLGVELDHIGQGLESMQSVPGRLNSCQSSLGVRLLDDSYNANPGSLKAALEVLIAYPGEHWLILGDMGELGSEAEQYHHQAGALAHDLGVSRLYAAGELSRHAVAAFGTRARHFKDVEALVAALSGDLHKDVTLLIKGSRAMRMERVVKSLQQVGS